MSMYFECHNPSKRLKKIEYPISPQVSIRLVDYRMEPNSIITVGPYMATANEIDYTVDNLIKDLEKFRVDAKKELREAQKKQLSK